MQFVPQWCRNAREVENKLIVQFLLPQLGYTYGDWYQKVGFKGVSFDFLITPVKVNQSQSKIQLSWCIIIEAKHPQEKLSRHLSKFKKYLDLLRVHYGVLTNGKEMRIYHNNFHNINLIFRCQGKDINQKIGQIQKLIGKQSIKFQANLLSETAKLNQEYESSTLDHPLSINPASLLTNMKTIAVYHNKGGVGKTTTVVNLAASLARKGFKILIIDLDSQANTTFAVGLAKFTDEIDDTLENNNIFHVIYSNKKYPLQEVAQKTTYSPDKIDAIPAHISLMEKERDLLDVAASRTRIRHKLQSIKNDYDYVLIDTPPSLNLYAKIALISADYLIIPSDLKPFANEGLKNVTKFIQEVNDDRDAFGIQQPIQILGVLPSKISSNSRFNQYTLPQRRAIISERYNLPLFETNIYEREDLAKALDNTILVGDLEIPDPKSIFVYKPDCLAAAEFEALALELQEKLG